MEFLSSSIFCSCDLHDCSKQYKMIQLADITYFRKKKALFAASSSFSAYKLTMGYLNSIGNIINKPELQVQACIMGFVCSQQIVQVDEEFFSSRLSIADCWWKLSLPFPLLHSIATRFALCEAKFCTNQPNFLQAFFLI